VVFGSLGLRDRRSGVDAVTASAAITIFMDKFPLRLAPAPRKATGARLRQFYGRLGLHWKVMIFILVRISHLDSAPDQRNLAVILPSEPMASLRRDHIDQPAALLVGATDRAIRSLRALGRVLH
jgi:hypothetical protein